MAGTQENGLKLYLFLNKWAVASELKPSAPPRNVPCCMCTMGVPGLAGRSEALAQALLAVAHLCARQSSLSLLGKRF